MQNRIEVFKQMLEADPTNTMVLFGLANEYQKAEDWQNAIETLEDYLQKRTTKARLTGCWQRLMNESVSATKQERFTKKASKFQMRTVILRWRAITE